MLPGASHRTLRADVDKLDHMLNLTGEIVIAQGRLRQMIEKLGSEQGRAILDMHREAERLYMDLQSEVMSIRMVPIGPLFRQFVRSGERPGQKPRKAGPSGSRRSRRRS
jgi:two-component system, chemotaxis family, sensor kinase CheA